MHISDPRPHHQTLRQPGWLALFIFLVAAIGWYVGLSIGVYSGRWHGEKTQAVLHWTPLPSAMVGWRPLSYASYLEQRRAVERYTTYLRSSTGGVYEAQSAAGMSATTLTQMIRLVISEQALKRLQITLTENDVNQAYTSQLLQNGDAEQVKTTINELYGWTPEQFKQYVIRPAIIREKLQEKLSFDETISGTQKKQAQEVLELVKSGQEDFQDLAEKYSDDVYGVNGGDLGFIKEGEQAKEIDEVAFTLEINQVSEVIHTKYGYHIIKPIERKSVDGVEQVQLLQITILAPPVDDYLNTKLKQSSLQVFVPGLGWDAQNGRVVQK